jgi:chemotaxis regulatin CheY-phosphate phosphatase CheZ
MLTVNGVFREVKRDMWTIKDVETARKKVDVIIKRLSKAANMTMDTCQQLHNLHKKLEEEAAEMKKRASFNNPFPNL